MDKFFKEIFNFDLSTSCKWLPANQFLFQMANLFLVLTYFVKPSGMAGLIQLRLALTCAGLCFSLWGGAVICSLDCMLWNLAFSVGNAVHLIYILHKVKPTPFKDRYEEMLFDKLFRPLNIKRYQFKSLISVAKQHRYDAGEYYVRQGITETKQNISVVVDGQFDVLINGKPINEVDQFEFLNSPEWLSVGNQLPTKYKVSLVASVDSVVCEWQKKELLKILKKDLILKNIFDSLIGKDLCKKFYSLHQTYLLQESSSYSTEASLFTYSAAVNLLNGQTSIPNRNNSPSTYTQNIPNTDTNKHNHEKNDSISIFCHESDNTLQLIPSETTLGYSTQKINFSDDEEDLSVSVYCSDHLLHSSKSSSLYRDEGTEGGEWYQSLDRQRLINLRETDL